MSLLLKECCDGIRSVPTVRSKGCGLSEIRDGVWHGGCVWMVELVNVAMWMVHGQVLIEKDRVEEGNIFNAD